MIEKYLNNRFLVLYITPFVLGALSILSFHPFNLTFLNFIIFPLFFYLTFYIKKKSKITYRKKPYKKNFFLFGLLFSFGFYLAGISWITNSLTFDENFKILIPFAFIIIPLALSLFLAFTILIVGPFLKFNVQSLLLFSLAIAISDYLRAKLFTGFPWNLWAYSTFEANEILQILNILGLYSYNLLVITLFVSPIIFFLKINKIKKFILLILLLTTIFSFYIFVNYKINNNSSYCSDNNSIFG